MTMAVLIAGALTAGAGLIGALWEFARSYGVWTAAPAFRSDDREAARARTETIRRDPSIRRVRRWSGAALISGVALMTSAMALRTGVERGTGAVESLWPVAAGAVVGVAIGFALHAAVRRRMRTHAAR